MPCMEFKYMHLLMLACSLASANTLHNDNLPPTVGSLYSLI